MGPNPPPPPPPPPQRTIQVKIGNQAAKEMTPDQAADYLKLIAAATSAPGGKRGGCGAGGAQVKMTFQNHGTEATLDFGTTDRYMSASGNSGSAAIAAGNNSTTTTTTTTITWGTTTTTASTSMSTSTLSSTSLSASAGGGTGFGVKKKNRAFGSSKSGSNINVDNYTAGFRLGQSLQKNNHSSLSSWSNNNNNNNNSTLNGTNNHNNNNNNNMPCTEKEMKALMSMFVEIMGLQMNTDKLNQTAAEPFQRPNGWLGAKQVPKPDVLHRLWSDKETLEDAANDTDDLLAALEFGPPPYNKDSDNDNYYEPQPQQVVGTKPPPPKDINKKRKRLPEPTTARNDILADTEGAMLGDNDETLSLSGIPDLEDIPNAFKAFSTPMQPVKPCLLKDPPAKSSPSSPYLSLTGGLDDGDSLLFLSSSASLLPNPHNYVLKENTNGKTNGIVCGIAVPEWETLERMAMEDALEQEERARKAATAAKRKVWRPLSGTARALDNAAFLEYNQQQTDPFGGGGTFDSHYQYHHHTSKSNKFGSGNNSCSASSNPNSLCADGNSKGSAIAITRDAASWMLSTKQWTKKCSTWRNRVAAACQSNNLLALKESLDLECPMTSLSSSINTVVVVPNNGSENDNETCLLQQWQPLLVHVLPKQRATTSSSLGIVYDGGKKQEEPTTRHVLLEYLLKTIDPKWMLKPDTRSGRSVLHSACFLGDVDTVQSVVLAMAAKHREKNKDVADIAGADKKESKYKIKRKSSSSDDEAKSTITNINKTICWDDPCLESGWTCLMYAAVASGSLRIVELLLQQGASVQARTSDLHTWLKQSNQGVTVTQLLQFCIDGTVSKRVETHGMTWSELQKDVTASHAMMAQYHTAWKLILKRLAGVADSTPITITPLKESEMLDFERAVKKAGAPEKSAVTDGKKLTTKAAKVVVSPALTSSKGSVEAEGEINEDTEEGNASNVTKGGGGGNNNNNNNKRNTKKQNKKKGGNKEPAATALVAAASATKPDGLESDSLTILLVDMGFDQESVINGIKALGGPNTATPDTVIAWMLDHSTDTADAVDGSVDKKPLAVAEEELTTAADAPAPASFTATSTNPRQNSRSSSVGQPQGKTTNQKPGQNKQESTTPSLTEQQRMLAKREEQRRRNREWNKKQEEAAAAAAAAAMSKKVAPPLAVTLKSTSPLPVPQPVAAMAAAVSSSSSLQGVGSNDISTVASSEGIPNDDATISTIESSRASYSQPQITQPFLLSGLPGMQQEQQQTSSLGVPPPGFSGLGGGGTVASNNRPPGIPESHPILEGSISFDESKSMNDHLLGASPTPNIPSIQPVSLPLNAGIQLSASGSDFRGAVGGGTILASGSKILGGHSDAQTSLHSHLQAPRLRVVHADPMGSASLVSGLSSYRHSFDNGPDILFHSSGDPVPSATSGFSGDPVPTPTPAYYRIQSVPVPAMPSVASSLFSVASEPFGTPDPASSSGFVAPSRPVVGTSLLGGVRPPVQRSSSAVGAPKSRIPAPGSLFADTLPAATPLGGSSLWSDASLGKASVPSSGNDRRSLLLGNVIPNDDELQEPDLNSVLFGSAVAPAPSTWGVMVNPSQNNNNVSGTGRHYIW